MLHFWLIVVWLIYVDCNLFSGRRWNARVLWVYSNMLFNEWVPPNQVLPCSFTEHSLTGCRLPKRYHVHSLKHSLNGCRLPKYYHSTNWNWVPPTQAVPCLRWHTCTKRVLSTKVLPMILKLTHIYHNSPLVLYVVGASLIIPPKHKIHTHSLTLTHCNVLAKSELCVDISIRE